MKAIRTRYSGPTNSRGSRIHATDSDGNRVSISYPYELNSDEAHELAAYTLMRKMKWNCELVSGGFVMLDRDLHVPPFYEVYFKQLEVRRGSL